MSQISELFDENTEELLHQDEDMKTIMAALIQDPPMPNVNADQAFPPLEIHQTYSGKFLPYQQLPLQQHTIREMPHADEQPSSVTNNNLDRVNKEEFVGDYSFDVFIDPHHAGTKSPWVYSAPLKKVFILINTLFPVDIKITPKPGEMIPELYVRVTPSYSNSQDSLTLVTRCLQHMQPNQNHDVPNKIWEHIIRCQNTNTSYHGGRHTQSHLSVLVPLSQPQNCLDTVRNMYQFVCKNSCPSGMNRRPLDIVFTLEDKYQNVLGRIILNARICSCPKRDKEKEEKEHLTRGCAPPASKKRKAEKRPLSSISQSTSDLAEYDLNVRIPGKHNLQAVCRYIHDLMAGEMLRFGTQGPYKRTINEVNQLTRSAE